MMKIMPYLDVCRVKRSVHQAKFFAIRARDLLVRGRESATLAIGHVRLLLPAQDNLTRLITIKW